MAEDDIAIVRRGFEAFSRRDLPVMAAELHADFEFNPLMSVWQQTYRGADGVAEWWRDLDDLWETFVVELDTYRELRVGVILIVGHWHAQPKGSGMAPIDAPIAGIIRIAGGKMTNADFYLSEDRALAAAAAAE
jgi:ketosteroid isomerase-like protein